MELLTAPANLPFSIALALVFLLGALELISLTLGGAVSIFGGDADVDMDGGFDGMDGDGFFGHIMHWLHAGQIPATVLLILFLLSFGSAGLLLQSTLKSLTGALMPALLAVVPAFLIALPSTRILGGVLKPIMPRDETEAVSRESFIGCSAQITSGKARRGAPAEARLRDAYGRSHYVMVEPEHDEEVFPAGARVVLLKRRDVVYRVIADANIDLDD